MTWHPRAAKDLKGLDRGVQRQVLDTIDGLSSGDPAVLAQTHPLKGTMKGWYATKASRGHRIIHQPTDDGGIHVGYVGLHEYGKAEQRLAALRATALYSEGILPEGFEVHYEPARLDERSSTDHKVVGTVPSEVRPGERNEVGTMHLDAMMDWSHEHGARKGHGPYTGPRRVSGISVDPRLRRRGIATALWEHAKALGLNPAHDDGGLQTWDGKDWAAATP